ncbi:hypothetical protein [Methylocaldum szegediense]|uniref:Uncharacterized protein n=1 Tax=Methylocaldum szegediense TaxID=73780 RepID=A0ABM9I623_9GAMM|nr:hypothetical protein [Methylocaldum szegediense]CAI8914758.1 conserved protein of unknown function [Methylocaldum szegediense]
MRSISEKDLAVIIPLLFNKIREMTEELRALEENSGELSDDQINECYELQECIEQYTTILDTLRQEYENGLAEGINLPSYEELIRAS